MTIHFRMRRGPGIPALTPPSPPSLLTILLRHPASDAVRPARPAPPDRGPVRDRRRTAHPDVSRLASRRVPSGAAPAAGGRASASTIQPDGRRDGDGGPSHPARSVLCVSTCASIRDGLLDPAAAARTHPAARGERAPAFQDDGPEIAAADRTIRHHRAGHGAAPPATARRHHRRAGRRGSRSALGTPGRTASAGRVVGEV
jgi:hypothetical protein